MIYQPMITRDDVLRTYKSSAAGEKALEKYCDLFPFLPSERLAGIFGDMISDGHLQGEPKWRLDFTSKEKTELKRFEKEFFSVFGVKGKIRLCTTNKFSVTYNYGINNKPIARILFLCGVPAGNKVLQSFSVPEWILENKIFFRRFIQRVLDCEGCVDTKGKYIELQMYKSEELLGDGFIFFKEIKKKLLKHYGIETTNPFTETRFNLRKDGIKTKAVRMKIKRKEDVIKFHKYINFENISKREKLDKIVKDWDGSSKLGISS